MKICVLALTVVCFIFCLLFAMQKPANAYVPFKNSQGKPFIWNLSTLSNQTVYWKADPAAPSLLRESMIATTKLWEEATGGVLKFAEGEGGITVTWDADGSKIYDTLFLAYTTFSADASSKIVRAQILVNAYSYSWQRGGYGGVGPFINGKREANLDSVMLHELGHALGLDHSDKNPSAIVGEVAFNDLPTMNSIIYSGAETLHADDEAGIRDIYQVPADAILEPQMSISASPLIGRKPLNCAFTVEGGDAGAVWDFGDGSTASGLNVTHKFTSYGTFTVTVRSNGKVSSTVVQVDKKAPRQKPAKKKRSGHSSSLFR
jgi:hypothetical protein